MPTVFETYGSERPGIGKIGEYDALAGLSEKAVHGKEVES